MKKKMLAFGAAAAALAFVPAGIANATTSKTNSGTSVSIDYYADFDIVGANVDLSLQVRCPSILGTGALDVWLDQAPPETPYPVGTGTGVTPVVCDGKMHSVGVTVVGAAFDVGKAKATATLVAGTPKVVSRQVYIRAV